MTKEREDKKPDVVVVVVNFVKDLVTGKVRNLIYAGLTILGTWGWASYQSKVAEIKLIASMPAKYTRLLEIRKEDSLRAVQYLKDDSLQRLANAVSFIALKHKVDSALSVHARWLQDDIDSIFVINKKLAKHKIK